MVQHGAGGGDRRVFARDGERAPGGRSGDDVPVAQAGSTAGTAAPVARRRANADAQIHSNSMYIEMAVGGGLLGGVAFLWLVWRAAGRCAAAVAVAAASERSWAIGIAAAGLAVLIHGLVDSFLSFTPTYIVISLTLGLAVACTSGAETWRMEDPDANRV